MARPTITIRDAINQLLKRNEYTSGAEVSELYLSKDILVATLKRPRIIEGTCWDVEPIAQTVDLFDLMRMHEEET